MISKDSRFIDSFAFLIISGKPWPKMLSPKIIADGAPFKKSSASMACANPSGLA